MKKNTKEPWRFVSYHDGDPEGTDDTDGDIVVGEDGDGYPIAQCVSAEHGPLLAAAPDLLAACKAMMAAKYGTDDCDVVEQMQAALRKAEA